MISYVLTPNPVLQLTDNEGKYVAYGSIRTLDWATREAKATYFDPGGLKPRPNPFPLDSIGRAFTVFWENDAAYYLELLDRFGNVVWTSSEPYIPGGSGSGPVTTNIEFENLFLNGQMRFFDQPLYEPIPDGITEDVALGDWAFEKNGTNLTDKIEFVKFTPDSTEVDATPIFYFNYVSTGSGAGETIKDFIFTIKDVRSLSSEEVTVGIAARSSLGGLQEVNILAEQFFGTPSTGVTPSPPITTPLGVLSLTTAWQAFNLTVTLPGLTGKTIGVNGDDKLGIRFRFPLNINANMEITNFYLKRGTATNTYPYETYAEVLASLNRLKFPIPNTTTDFPNTTYPTFQAEQAYDALMLIPDSGRLKEIWLPPIPIGTTLPFPSDEQPPGWVRADGSALLQVGEYNRLYNVPFSGSRKFGTVYGKVANNIETNHPWGGLNTRFVAFDTKPGVTEGFTAGNSGFTLQRVAEGHVSDGIHIKSFTGVTAVLENTVNGAVSATTTNTTMVITQISLGSPSVKGEWSINCIAASAITGGQYVLYHTTLGSFYIWFNKDGVGSDPGLGGTPHEVKITTGVTAEQVRILVMRAIEGFETDTYITLDGASIAPGAYIEVGILGKLYSPYYRVSGSITTPSGTTGILVPIDILVTDTAAEVAARTASALNPLLWKMPDWRGSFMRFWDIGRGLDPNSGTRTDRGDGVTGDNVGTYQADEAGPHIHALDSWTGLLDDSGGNAGSLNVGTGHAIATQPNTGAETRPKNYYFNAIVKY